MLSLKEKVLVLVKKDTLNKFEMDVIDEYCNKYHPEFIELHKQTKFKDCTWRELVRVLGGEISPEEEKKWDYNRPIIGLKKKHIVEKDIPEDLD